MESFFQKNNLDLAKALQNDDFDYSRVADVIKNTKTQTQRQGLKFLPRKLNDLVKSLLVWLEELAETGKTEVRNKVAAVLEELLRRKGISHDRYTAIKEVNNIW